MFDIVIPILNMKTKYLKECLESIKNQTFGEFKCYIVDGTPENWKEYKKQQKMIKSIMKKDERFEYHRHPNLEEPYVSESQNHGLKLGDNPYVQFLGGDDFFYPHHLLNMKQFIEDEKDNDVAFWFCMVKTNEKTILDFGNFKVGRVSAFIENHYILYSFLNKNIYPLFHSATPIFMNGLMLKRDEVEGVGGFNEDYEMGEDVDLVRRIVKTGKHGRWLPYVGAYLRKHDGQTTNRKTMDKLSKERIKKWVIGMGEQYFNSKDLKVGWDIGWDNLQDMKQDIQTKDELKLGMANPKHITDKNEIKREVERVSKMLGKEITMAEYEVLQGLTGSQYHSKTVLEIANEETMFILHNDDELDKFIKEDIIT